MKKEEIVQGKRYIVTSNIALENPGSFCITIISGTILSSWGVVDDKWRFKIGNEILIMIDTKSEHIFNWLKCLDS